jgi:hypothetical protein
LPVVENDWSNWAPLTLLIGSMSLVWFKLYTLQLYKVRIIL